MTRRSLATIVLFLGLVLSVSGCVVSAHHDHGHGARYWDGRHWVYARGHAHGPSCGHVYVRGSWVYAHHHVDDCYCID